MITSEGNVILRGEGILIITNVEYSNDNEGRVF